MGSMKVIKDGIRVTGRSEFDKPVHFRKLSTAKVSKNNFYFEREREKGVEGL